MADLKKLLADATRSLTDGNSERALQLLTDFEERARCQPDQINGELTGSLMRLAELARAAQQGIFDARVLIADAGAGARSLKTYDGNGNPQPVNRPRTALGRF